MFLKRIYDPGSVEAGKPRVSHLRVQRASQKWYVSPSVVEQGVAEGYFALADGHLTLKTAEGEPDVVYKILTPPGWYCCHCGKRLNDSREGLLHVKADHPGVQSPDPNNPSGWRRDNHYTLDFVSGTEVKPERPLHVALRSIKAQTEGAAANE